ncbi:MAG: DUF7507 domain-containing protein [Maricaulaceae bacterium]
MTNIASATDGTTTSPDTDETVKGDQTSAMTVAKTALTTSYSSVGDTLSYQYVVTNTGNVTLTSAISVNDNLIPSVSCPSLPAGGLAPAQTLTCSASYAVTQADIDAGSVTNIASATDGTTTSPDDDATVTADQTPAMTVAKTALTTSYSSVGDTLSYQYVVTNTGNVTLTSAISVNDNLIASVSCPSLPAGGLAPAQTLTCTATYTVTQADIDNGSVTNIASATDGTTTSPDDNATVTADRTSAMTVAKTALTTSYSAVGDTLSYQYVVTNTGNVTLTSAISVNDNLIPSVSCPALPAGGLAPTQTLTCNASYTVTQADIDAGSVTNIASATDGTTTSPDTDATVKGTSAPALTLVKNVTTTSFAAVGDVLNYTFTVINSGNVTITNPIIVTDNRIPSVSCPALPAGGLAPSASIVCTGSDTVTQADLNAGTVTNIASATDGTTSSPSVSETVSATQLPEFTLVKSAITTSYVAVGDFLTYNYVVTNTGNVTHTTPITITDDKIGSFACGTLPAGGLTPGASLSCPASYIATQADVDIGYVKNIATASSGGITSNVDAVVIQREKIAGMSVEKSALATSYSAVGDVISYTYVVTNTGDLLLTDPITVTDDLIPTITCPALPAGGLVVGGSLTCTGDYTVTQADIDAESVTNIASATDGTTTSDPDTVTVEADITRALTIEKLALQTGYRNVGDVISYEYIVTNAGNITMIDPITVTDNLISSVNCPALPVGGLAPTATLTCTATYTITQADIDALSVTNIASATDGTTDSPETDATVVLERNPEMHVTKAVASLMQVGGPIYDVTYDIVMTNTGDMTLTGLQLEDNLALHLAPTTIYSTPSVTMSGFTGGTVNTNYDGAADIETLTGGPSLAVGEEGIVSISVRIDTTEGGPAQGNTAIGNSPDLPDPVPSDDPEITPEDEEDINPTPTDVTDTDKDGVADANETKTEDRDGDGVPDAMDYDPTGYFYCEDDGQILKGGGISIAGPSGSNSTVGTANDIVIVQDGSTGYYQFYVTAPGRYTITPTYPDGGVPSTKRLVQSSSLDVTTLLPSNPAVLGSSEFGTSGKLADYSEAKNSPFYFEFEFEAGDPSVLMNNIPLSQCRQGANQATDTTQLSVMKTAQPRTVQIGDPVRYTITVANPSGSDMTDMRIVDRIPAGFAYVPNSAVISDATDSTAVEPDASISGLLTWPVSALNAAPLDEISSGEALTVTMNLIAGPNVAFGAHENKAYVEDSITGDRSLIASAVVDYIPEPSFDCTPVIGRVYDDVNHNGYPDDGEPGLPAVRLVTINGDIITTDEYGRYHIPCAIIAHSERGSNFLLKADTRTLPLGYLPTTENPRVMRATRGKFVKMNFGAAHRTKLRIDLFANDFVTGSESLTGDAWTRIRKVMDEAKTAGRAILVYHADENDTVDSAQDILQRGLRIVRGIAPSQFDDIALEATWGEAQSFTRNDVAAVGQVFETTAEGEARQRTGLFVNDNGRIEHTYTAKSSVKDGTPRSFGDSDQQKEAGMRGGEGSDALASDMRDTGGLVGRRAVGDDQSARPGRLQRWTQWGGSTTSYAEGMEIETTTDALDPVKRLNVQANVVSDTMGRAIRAESYWNYDAFITRAELRVFDADKSVRGTPLAITPIVDGKARLIVTEDLPEHMVYVLRAYTDEGIFDETAPKRLHLGGADQDLSESDWNFEAGSAFGQNTLLMSNIGVRGGTVRVFGRNVPGRNVTVMGQTIRVDADGQFVAEQLLPTGQQPVSINVDGVNATQQRIIRSVDVKTSDIFYVGQVEATIGKNIAADAEGNRSFEEGRVAFYLRSRLNDKWNLTAMADTGEAAIENLLDGLDDKDTGQLLRRLDPERFYPVYGDDSTIEQDAPTSGRFYARLERGSAYGLWGNYQTNFNDTEYARIQRTLYGAKFHWSQEGNPTAYGDDRTRLTGYIAEGGSRQGRDELVGTGGSVYYLRHGDIAVGSETLRIETRDAVSGLVLETRRLAYGTDYDMDFIQGRVILSQPLGTYGADGRLFRDGSQSGNEQLLVADYEFTPITSTSNAAIYGVRGTRWFGDRVKLGGTYNHDTDGGAESDLYELDLTLQYAAGTYLKGEVAVSEGQGVEAFKSIDGGFTYNPQARGGLALNKSARAYAIEGAIDFTELESLTANGTTYGYWRKREAGFAGYAEATNQTVEQYGAGANFEVAKGLDIAARGDISDDQFQGKTKFGELRADYEVSEDLSISAGMSYNEDSTGRSGTSVGARVDYEIDKDNNVYVFGQASVSGNNTRTTDRMGVGGETRLSKKIFGGGEISTGEDGLGARATARYEYEDGDEIYLAYDLPLSAQASSNYGTMNLGARRRFTDALSVYGEERFQFNTGGLNGVTHAYGVDYKPGNWNMGIAAEVGRVDDVDREAFSASFGFSDDRMKAGITGEWREDQNILTSEERRTWLLRTAAQYQASEEMRLQGKINVAVSKQTSNDPLLGPRDFNEAEFVEASLAAAYRPIWDDRFNMLAKFVWLEDLSPTSQRFNGETLNYRQKSRIASIDTAYDITSKWTVGGKYAYRSGSVTSNRDLLDFTKSEAHLGVIRLDYHATHQWDAVIEGRYLDIGGAVSRKGGLAGLYRHVNDNAKIGVGVTWGAIEEEYLATVGDKDELGWFLNVVGKF